LAKKAVLVLGYGVYSEDTRHWYDPYLVEVIELILQQKPDLVVFCEGATTSNSPLSGAASIRDRCLQLLDFGALPALVEEHSLSAARQIAWGLEVVTKSGMGIDEVLITCFKSRVLKCRTLALRLCPYSWKVIGMNQLIVTRRDRWWFQLPQTLMYLVLPKPLLTFR
jgi:hypothetical protein